MPYTKVWNTVSDNAKKAFEESNSLVVEIDLTKQSNLFTFERCQLLPNNRLLSQEISPELFTR